MINIANFFHKFQNIDKNNSVRIDKILEIIKKEVGVIVDKNNIKIIGDTIVLNCSPVIKNEIAIKKDYIEKKFIIEKIFLSIR